MERAGLKVDRAVLNELSNFLGAELQRLTEQIYKLAGREFTLVHPSR
jgi:DNA polymerase I-like protein with 3'-5' exonuclease and polymerase domains